MTIENVKANDNTIIMNMKAISKADWANDNDNGELIIEEDWQKKDVSSWQWWCND